MATPCLTALTALTALCGTATESATSRSTGATFGKIIESLKALLDAPVGLACSAGLARTRNLDKAADAFSSFPAGIHVRRLGPWVA